MKKPQFTATQIVSILKEGEAGLAVKEVCRTHGISSATYYKWRSKYGGLEASELKRIKELGTKCRPVYQSPGAHAF